MVEAPLEPVAEARFLYPTPGGAWYAVQGLRREPARALLQSLLIGESTPALEAEWVATHAEVAADDVAELLRRMQSLGLLQGLAESRHFPEGAIDQLLAASLQQLSEQGRAALADSQGLYVASAGFAHESAEELAALSAELAALGERHSGLLNANLGLAGSGWGLIGASGLSDIGFWPMYLGGQRFALIVQGQPQFNQPALIQLLWALGRRYGKAAELSADTRRATVPADESRVHTGNS
mgnify:CR=1 FL=1